MSLPHLLKSRSVIIKETHMALDNIIVFVLAIGFFGGLIFLALKGRRDTTREGQPSSSPAQNNGDACCFAISTAGKGAAEIERLILVEPG